MSEKAKGRVPVKAEFKFRGAARNEFVLYRTKDTDGRISELDEQPRLTKQDVKATAVATPLFKVQRLGHESRKESEHAA